MMHRDDGAEFGLRVRREERVQRSLGAIACAFSRNFFDLRHKLGIKRGAAPCQVDGGELTGIFWRWRNDSRAGPRSFFTRALPVEHRDAQTRSGEFQSNRS